MGTAEARCTVKSISPGGRGSRLFEILDTPCCRSTSSPFSSKSRPAVHWAELREREGRRRGVGVNTADSSLHQLPHHEQISTGPAPPCGSESCGGRHRHHAEPRQYWGLQCSRGWTHGEDKHSFIQLPRHLMLPIFYNLTKLLDHVASIFMCDNNFFIVIMTKRLSLSKKSKNQIY